ncbi:unnamed protein product [Ophioblennius macclurei]
MAKRKTKKPQPEDTSVLLDSPVVKAKRKTNFNVPPALLCVIALTVGASIMGWFCLQQQHSIDHLSESFTTMQQRVTNYQKVIERHPDELDDLSVEERIYALEESQKQAQEKAEAALAASEEVKTSDLFSQLVALKTEINTQWDEMKQAAFSVTTLRGFFKNKSEELEVMKEKVASALSVSSTLSESMDGLTSACSRVAEQVSSVDALSAQVEAHASEMNDLKDLLYLHSVALQAHNREMAKMKEVVKARQIMRAQALEEMLNLVRTTLDKQFFTSQSLHSSVLAQLETFQSQLVNGPSWPIKHKEDEKDLIASTSHSDNEEQESQEDVEDQADQDSTEDEDEAVEEVMKEDDADVAEEEEEITTEEEEEEEDDITEQVEEEEDSEEEAEEEESEDRITGHISDESFEEEEPEEDVEGSESTEGEEEEEEEFE